MRSLLQIAIGIVIFWLIFTYLLPLLPPPFSAIMLIILVIALIVWLLRLIGVPI